MIAGFRELAEVAAGELCFPSFPRSCSQSSSVNRWRKLIFAHFFEKRFWMYECLRSQLTACEEAQAIACVHVHHEGAEPLV